MKRTIPSNLKIENFNEIKKKMVYGKCQDATLDVGGHSEICDQVSNYDQVKYKHQNNRFTSEYAHSWMKVGENNYWFCGRSP